MLSFDLASILIVTFVIVCDMRVCNQWLATSTQSLLASAVIHDFDAEEPESTRRDFVTSQTFFGFQLLVDIFDACLFAVVIVIGAVVVSHVVRKVFCPRVCIGGEILRSHWLATGIENGFHLAIFSQ